MTSSLIPSFSGFFFAGSAPSVAITSKHEVFSRKQMPMNTVGFSDINPRWVYPQMNMLFRGKDFEMPWINAGRRLADMVQMHLFRNRSAKHQAMNEERLSVYINSAIARSGYRSSPEPTPGIWFYFVFFLKHLLCISAFS